MPQRALRRSAFLSLCLVLLSAEPPVHTGAVPAFSAEMPPHPVAQTKIVLVVDAFGKFRLHIESATRARDYEPIAWFDYLLFLDKTLYVLQEPWASRVIADLSRLAASPSTSSQNLIYQFDPRRYSRLTSIEIQTFVSKRGFYGLNTYFESEPEPLLPPSLGGAYYENSGIEKALTLFAEYWFASLPKGARETFRSYLKTQLEMYQEVGYPKDPSRVFMIPNLLLRLEPVRGAPKY